MNEKQLKRSQDKIASKRKPQTSVHSKGIGITPLMRAATHPDDLTELLRLLVIIGEMPHDECIKHLFATDHKNRSALDWARISNNYQGVTLLLHSITTAICNARVNALVSITDFQEYIIKTNNIQGQQLREALRLRNSQLAFSILKENKLTREEVEALKQEFFIDWPGPIGYTPVMLAAGMNMRDVLEELIKLKAPVNASNRFGHSALTIACSAGNTDVVEYLLCSGADVHHRTKEGRTPLHYCCLYAKAKIVRIMLDFLIERFAVFRIEGHSLVDFDYTRWTSYSSILESLLNVRKKYHH